MPEHLHEVALAPAKAAARDTYFKLQVKAWTRFDPTQADLSDIARAVEDGTAFVSAVEVARVAAGLNEIDDADVREQFENLAAAERVLRNIEELPTPVREKLRSVLLRPEARERNAG